MEATAVARLEGRRAETLEAWAGVNRQMGEPLGA